MSQTFELPVFALRTVLFPGGVLPLKIFEQRYMRMAKDCLKLDLPFGVCLIAEGQEVGAPATPHGVGTTARISTWDMPQLGVLQVTARGEQRFRILERRTETDGLVRATAEWIAPEPRREVPEQLLGLLPLLRAIASDLGQERMPPPHAFEDAVWVGCRYAEILPIPLAARQKLLELEDAVMRLTIISQFLAQRDLLE
jgi:hypothetical protein